MTLIRWIERYTQTGNAGFAKKPGPIKGNHLKISKPVIINLLSTSSFLNQAPMAQQLNCSVSTFARALSFYGISFKKVPRAIFKPIQKN